MDRFGLPGSAPHALCKLTQRPPAAGKEPLSTDGPAMNARLLCLLISLAGTFVVGCGAPPPPPARDLNGATPRADRQRHESGVRFEEPNPDAGDQPLAGHPPGRRELTPAEEDAERKRKQFEREYGM